MPDGRRILVIALHYPPADGAAAIRARNLVRNLQALGHDVLVITPRTRSEAAAPPEARPVRWLDLESLARRALGRRPRSNGVLPAPPPWQRGLRATAATVLVPDLYLPWIPVAWLAARSEARRADLIISTGGASAHIVAQLLEGSKPTVVDINDLWWRNPRRDSGPNRDRVDRWLEKRIISRATALIVPVAEQGDEVARRWGRPSTAVPTGFDPSDFGSPETNAAPRSAQHEILFAGTLYENFQVNLIFEALVAGRETYGWSPERLRVVFIGSGSGKALSVARAYGIGEFVGGVPPMSRHELMNRLVAADALLLPLYAEDPHHLPMRFFEFVGAGRPLIGIGSADVPAGKLLRTHGLGPVCETVEDLVAAFEHVASNSRLPELPSATRALFDVTRSKPALQGLIDDVMAPDVGRNA